MRQEIDERQAIERHLRLSESRLNSIFNSAPEGIAVIDTQGTIIQADGADGYVSKPISAQALRAEMARVMGLKRLASGGRANTPP